MKAERAGRRQFLETHVPALLDRTILEIGAADNPTFWPNEGKIKYLDILSAAELRHKYEANPNRNPKNVVAVNYVTHGQPLDEIVDERFALVIANHVIEHVPDLLGWLDRVRRVTADDGHLSLAIPDRRYTFDYLRRATDVIDLLEHHLLPSDLPDIFTQLRGAYYHRPVKMGSAPVAGRIDERVLAPIFSLRQAAERVRDQAKTPFDVHSHVFTYDTFLELWRELDSADLVSWSLISSEDVTEGNNEFRVLLGASAPSTSDFPLEPQLATRSGSVAIESVCDRTETG